MRVIMKTIGFYREHDNGARHEIISGRGVITTLNQTNKAIQFGDAVH
jgi:hypothetical protein